MDRVTAMPHEIELELKKFELKISKLNKEEMFKELMLLKFDSENNFYFIKKYLSKHGMKISRQIIQRHNTDHVVIACLLYTSPSPRDLSTSRMPSSA